MCLIILREPNVTLDKKDFLTAVMNNPDGWGISVPDTGGKLYTYKDIDTDAEALYELLHTEFKSDKFMLHLRYTTAGDTVLRNAHPFPILEQESDGVDLRMAHNGTLYDYSPSRNAPNSWESDTRVFTRKYVRPLFKRLIRGTTAEDLLTDPFVNDILENQLTKMSVITFLDGNGNSLLVNAMGNGGFKDNSGTYFSNKYSFDETHRLPTYSGGSATTMGKSRQGSSTPSGKSTLENTTGSTTTFSDCNTELFSSKYSLTDDEDLYFLSDEAIDSLIKTTPDDAALLVKELLLKLYKTDKKLEKATRTIHRKSLELKELSNPTVKETRNDKVA